MAKKSKTDKDAALLKTMRDRQRQSSEAEDENRRVSIEDSKFENGDQWEESARTEREDDGRPCLTINKTAATVKQIVGDMRQNKLSIKVRPVDSDADPGTAELMTGLIRNIENISHAEDAYDYAAECAIRGAFGYFRILTDYARNDVFDQDILIKRIVNPYSVYFDPAATESDYSDARWCIITQPLSKEEFEATYPGKMGSDTLELGEGESEATWFTDETVTVAEYWVVKKKEKRLLLLSDGKTVDADDLSEEHMMFIEQNPGAVIKERLTECNSVEWYKVTGSEILEGPKQWAGEWIPIVPVLGEEVWIEGKRVLRSAIRWAKDPNRLYNWSRSNAVETLALAPKQPFLVTPAMIEGHEAQWNDANHVPQPYLVYNPDQTAPGGSPQRQPLGLPDTGAIQEAAMASDDIKATTGYFDASLGSQGNEQSGKAIIARQRQSNTSTFTFTDNLRRSLEHAGRILVDLIPKIYDTERAVRLLGHDGAEDWAVINKQDPNTGQKLNDLSVGKYDVTVETGPAYSTKRLEAADGMVSIIQAAPQYAQVLIPELVKNLDWPGAQEIAEMLKQMSQPQGPDPKQEMELAKGQQELQKGQVEIEGKQLDNQQKAFEAMKAQVELEMEGAEGDQKTYNIAQMAVLDIMQRMGG